MRVRPGGLRRDVGAGIARPGDAPAARPRARWPEGLYIRSFPTALGSDATSRSPFVGLYSELSLPFATHPPREVLVRAYTWGSAYTEFAEQEKGTLAPGMLADIAVLSQDVFTVPVDALPRTESVLTMVGGKVVWDAGTVRSAAGRAR